MGHGTFQNIWKLPDQIRADLGTPFIQGLLDTVSKLLAVRGRALFPQAAPVEQVPGLQVQGAGPRQERPGRAAVGAHGSCRRRGPGSAGAAERWRASGRAGELADGCLAGRGGAPGPRGEREAADSARPQPGVRSGPRRPGGDGEAVREGGKEGRKALARTVAAASAAATAAAAETRELFPGRQ